MENSTPIPVQSYRDLIAWRKAMELAREIYRRTELFPRVEIYGLIAQLRGAAVSTPSKIAGGHERTDYRQFLAHALGSLMEIETQILLAADLGYLEETKAETLLQRTAELAKILHGLLRSLQMRIRTN